MVKIKGAFYEAYVGEAKAALRLKVFADKADQEGYPQIGKLFRVIAFSEEIHGARSLRMLKEIKSTEDNLATSFESETNVAAVTYDTFIRWATDEENETATTIFTQSRDVEDTHARLYKEAMGHLMEERETAYYVCKVCGFVSDGSVPDECPVCGSSKEQFVSFQ